MPSALRPLRGLVECECSARVRNALAARPGWEVWSADTKPSEKPAVTVFPDGTIEDSTPGDWPMKNFHYQGDGLDLFDPWHPVNDERRRSTQVLYPLWDIIIAHPPCTNLAYAGAVWFKVKDSRRGGDGRMQEGAEFFMKMLNAPSPLVAVENPHSIIQEPQWAGPPTQTVQPWMFGNGFEKRIDLWLKGLPPLKPTHTEADYPELFRGATGGGSWRTDKAAGKQAMSAYEDSEGRSKRATVRSRTFLGLAQAMADQWGSFAEEFYHEQELAA